MQLRKEIKKSGLITYRYRYYYHGELKSVKKDKWPFTPENDVEAESLRKKLESMYEADKSKIDEDNQWHLKYKDDLFDFAYLLEEYTKLKKLRAPNNYSNQIGYLINHVFYFFLTVKEEKNVQRWQFLVDDFNLYLHALTSKKTGRKIAKSTINHIINELNLFVKFLHKRGLLQNVFFIERIEKKQLNERGIEFVFSDDEITNIINIMRKTDEVYADFFELLLATGMRFNELKSLKVINIKKGRIPLNQLSNLVENSFKKPELGYIILSEQLKKDKTPKPLKGRPRIDAKYQRYVPIIEKDIYNKLVKYIKIAEGELLFFDKIENQKMNKYLHQICSKLKIAYKSIHSTRHTFATNLGGLDLTGILQRFILGHSESIAKRYNHINQRLNNQLKDQINLDREEWDYI